jgi:hypothetical protein
MATSSDLYNAIYDQLDRLRAGSLSFWGDWFGRPYDNIHRIVGADASDDVAVIYFDHAESLVIESPRVWSLMDGLLMVQDAERVRFQWFYYGNVPSADTLKFVEYQWIDGEPIFRSDFEPLRIPDLSWELPAVQLHLTPHSPRLG